MTFIRALTAAMLSLAPSVLLTQAPIHVYAFKNSADEVTLIWSPPPGEGGMSTSYNIFRMGKKIGKTVQNTYKDTGLHLGEGYAYSVTALAASGVESSQSAVVTAIMPFTSGVLERGDEGLCRPNPPARLAEKNVDAVIHMLPGLLADADMYEDLTLRLPASTSLDFLRMSVRMLRSVPVALRCDPGSLAWVVTPAALLSIQEAMRYFYAHARNGTDPYQGSIAGVVPVKSSIDEYIDFYVFRLPKDYTPAKKYPLYIDLHAASYCRWEAGGLAGPIAKPNSLPSSQQSASGNIYLTACARGPATSYAIMAQESIFEAIADASHRFSVDADRITIRGASMGATGALRLSALYPDVFAGTGALTGSPFYRLPPKDYRYDATVLAPNLKNLNVVLWEAKGDPGTLALEEPLDEALRTLRANQPGYYNFRNYIDPRGAHGVVDRDMLQDGEKFLASASRNRYPRSVHYITGSEQYDGAYWIRGMTRDNVKVPGEIDLQASGNIVIVKTSNLKSFSLDLGGDNELFKAQSNVAVTVDGEPHNVVCGSVLHFIKNAGWTVAVAAPAGIQKRKGVSGPVADVFMHGPVLMVYGTKDGNDAVRGRVMTDELLQAYFGAPEGADIAFHYGPFEVKADTEVTDEDIRSKNLVLFGTPAQNSMVARIAPNLTFEFSGTGGRVNGKSFGGQTGWSILNPNPLNSSHYVLLVSEHVNMSTLSSTGINSNVLQNDWVLVQPARGNNTRILVGHGSFDNSWR